MALFLLRVPLLLAQHAATLGYPLYASYKALAPSPATPGTAAAAGRRRSANAAPPLQAHDELLELQTWSMYWSVVALLHLAETWLEWSWSWIPFYFEAKLLFMLWLVLPQTRGATLLYTTYIDPFLSQHEEAIDTALSEAKAKAKAAGLAWVARMWERVKGSVLNAALAQEQPQSYTMSNPGAAAAQPPPQASPFLSLFQTYAPAAIAFGSNALNRARAGAVEPPPAASKAGASRRAPKLKPQSSSTSLGRSAAATRRRELERQLAELDAASGSSSDDGATHDSLQVPSLRPGGGARRTSSPTGYSSSPAPSSDEDRRARGTNLGGSYEMLDRLSVDISAANAAARSRPGSSGSASQQQKPNWFWGGGSSPTKSPTKKKTQ